MNLINEFETIAAIATPLGVGGIGIIRISGPLAFVKAQEMFSKKIKSGFINHGEIYENGVILDEAVLLAFKGPNSYTGEDVIEFQVHGGISSLNRILQAVIKKGVRYAQKGEFTKRAFLNHKMDLTQAEAVLDLIHAKTSDFAILSAKNLKGALKIHMSKIREDIFNLLIKIMASVDFPEDVAEPSYGEIILKTENAIKEINSILKNADSYNIARSGIKLAIAGKPNVGKSSLFNALLNLERAIVTDIAGTTRDIIQETLIIEGVATTLCDTAGIREGEDIDKVEKIGIDYSKQSLEEADLVLFVYESSNMCDEDYEILNSIKDKNHIIVASKADLNEKKDENAINISVKTLEGLEELKEAIKNKVLNIDIDQCEFSTNIRQQECLKRAQDSLECALGAAKCNELQDLISIDIKGALLALDEISGEVITDDILNNIFDNFCIGK